MSLAYAVDSLAIQVAALGCAGAGLVGCRALRLIDFHSHWYGIIGVGSLALFALALILSAVTVYRLVRGGR